MIKELDNTEISCVYYQFEIFFKEMEDNLNSGFYAEKTVIDIGVTEVQPIIVTKITEEEVAAIRGSHFYLTVKSIVNKLKPIVDMIEEAEPEIKNKLDA